MRCTSHEMHAREVMPMKYIPMRCMPMRCRDELLYVGQNQAAENFNCHFCTQDPTV